MFFAYDLYTLSSFVINLRGSYSRFVEQSHAWKFVLNNFAMLLLNKWFVLSLPAHFPHLCNRFSKVEYLAKVIVTVFVVWLSVVSIYPYSLWAKCPIMGVLVSFVGTKQYWHFQIPACLDFHFNHDIHCEQRATELSRRFLRAPKKLS